MPSVRRNGPRLGWWLSLLVLPPFVAAPLRVLARVPVGWSVAAAIAVTALAAVALRRVLPRPESSSPLEWRERVLAATLPLAAVGVLYHRALSGLPNWISSDAGNQAAVLRQLVGSSGAYEGFISMHLAWWAVERALALNPLVAFAVVYYAQLAVVVALALCVGLIGQRVTGALGAASLTMLVAVVLPLEHYLQSEGFWAQLFALVPLVLLWWCDASLPRWWQRTGAWIVGVAVLRFTYGLNLIELLLATAWVLLREPPWRLRWLGRAAALACLIAATLVSLRLDPWLSTWGWFVRYPIPLVLAGMGLLVLGIALHLWQRPDASLLSRVRAPLVFGTASLAVTAIQYARFGSTYYVYKYPLLAICLLALCAPIVVADLWPDLAFPTGPRGRGAARLCVALILGGVGLWCGGFWRLYPTYFERALGVAGKLRPLADLAAWDRIDRICAREHKLPGGYLVSYGPMSNFMNSAMGVAHGQKFYFEGQPPRREPGYCVFWDETSPDPWPDFDRWYVQRPLVDALAREPEKRCEDYAASWDAELNRRLCHLCR